jgi:hypothetical protein
LSQIGRLIDLVALILLDTLAPRPGIEKPSWAAEFGVASEYRTYGARISFHDTPALPGWAMFGRPALRALTNYWVAHFTVPALLLTGEATEKKS